MYPKLTLLAGLALATGLTPLLRAETVAPDQDQNTPPETTLVATPPGRAEFGEKKTVFPLQHVEIRNLQGDRLGRIRDVSIDLAQGRVVEVLVVSGDILGMGGKVVSVPPGALTTDDLNEVYFLNVTPAVFEAAPEVDVSNTDTTGQNTRIAAAYRHFGREPYFKETGEPVTGADKLPRTTLNQSLTFSRLLGLDVRNRKDEVLGTVSSASIDIRKAEVATIIVLAPDGTANQTIIPTRSLRYSATNNHLVLDDTPAEFEAKPQYVQSPADLGNPGTSQEEPYTGPTAGSPLEQGATAPDKERTALIKKEIRAAKIGDQHIQVATLNGRVTLRGRVATEADKNLAGQIAIRIATLERVDNQLEVRAPAKKS